MGSSNIFLDAPCLLYVALGNAQVQTDQIQAGDWLMYEGRQVGLPECICLANREEEEVVSREYLCFTCNITISPP